MTNEESQGVSEEAEQAASNVPKPGELLRVQREAAGLSFATVGEALHLTVHYVKALENDDYAKLPGLTFVKGYFKSYARFLNMDVDLVISCYENYVKELGDQVSEQEHSYRVRKRNDQVVIWAVIAGLILVAGVVAGWWFFGRSSDDTASNSSNTHTPAVQNVTETKVTETNETNVTVTTIPDYTGTRTTVSAEETLDALLAENDQSEAGDPIYVSEDVQQEFALGEELDVIPADSTANATNATNAESGTENAAIIDSDNSVLSSEDQQELVPQTPVLDEGNTAPVVLNGYTEESVLTEDGARKIQLFGEGNDVLALNFRGTTWVEVDDAAEVRLYNDLMRQDDALVIHGVAPFYVLLGDATQAELQLNTKAIDFSNRIRIDKSARFIISNDGASRWVAQ